MTLAPRDYIIERRRDIYQRMEALRAELQALDRMESALAEGPLMGAGAADQAKTPAVFATKEAATHRRRRVIEGGIKSLIMDVLTSMEGNMTATPANSILRKIKERHGVDLPRTSLSPQLSRLRKEGMVSLVNGMWYATAGGRAAYPNQGEKN
jgi:hypothetical protein